MTTTLTIREIAERLQVTHATVHRWVKRGYFPNAYRAGPGRTSPYRIPVEDVEALETRLRQTPANQEPEQ